MKVYLVMEAEDTDYSARYGYATVVEPFTDEAKANEKLESLIEPFREDIRTFATRHPDSVRHMSKSEIAEYVEKSLGRLEHPYYIETIEVN